MSLGQLDLSKGKVVPALVQKVLGRFTAVRFIRRKDDPFECTGC